MKTDETDIDQSCANIEVETSQPFSHKKVVWLRFSNSVKNFNWILLNILKHFQ